MPVLPTPSTKKYGRRSEDEDAQTRLLSDGEHLARSKQQTTPSPAPPFREPSESDSEAGHHRTAQSELHHSPAGYRTPPDEKHVQHGPLPLPSQETFSVPYERVPDADAAHRAALKRRSQHQQPQQQILPEASQARLQTQQLRGDQAAQSSQTARAQRPANRAQPIVPPLPRLATDTSATTKTVDEPRRIPMVKRRPSPSLAAPKVAATATTDASETAGGPIVAESRGIQEEAAHQPFNLWGAVDGAAAALARLRIGVPHAPIVVTPTTAPVGFTFEAVDGHHSEDTAFHNPPDAAAVAESEAARRTETTAANAASAEANPRSRVLDALVAGISRFGVLGIHHPVWFW